MNSAQLSKQKSLTFTAQTDQQVQNQKKTGLVVNDGASDRHGPKSNSVSPRLGSGSISDRSAIAHLDANFF